MNESLQTSKQIAEITKEAISKLGVSVEIETEVKEQGDEEVIVVQVKCDSPNLLIGQYGVNLTALQHLIRLIVRRRLEKTAHFVIDVNDYKDKRREYLERLARETADKVIQSSRLIILKPMSAYERRIIHMVLSKNKSIVTESLGEDPNRRVVVKPVTGRGQGKKDKDGKDVSDSLRLDDLTV